MSWTMSIDGIGYSGSAPAQAPTREGALTARCGLSFNQWFNGLDEYRCIYIEQDYIVARKVQCGTGKPRVEKSRIFRPKSAAKLEAAIAWADLESYITFGEVG